MTRVDLFRTCASKFIDNLCILLREEHLPPDNYLFRLNEPGRNLFIVASGSVELTVESLDGSGEVVEATKTAAEPVGELAFFFN